MQCQTLVAYLNDLLQVSQYQDYAPNGLQVQGCEQIERIVCGVTASQALIDAAIDLNADAIIVHHGYFWKNEPLTLTGIKYQRIKKLLDHDINLLAYHLPLDSHSELGNNAQLAKLWRLQDITPSPGLVRLGELAVAMSIDEFVQQVEVSLSRRPLHLPGGPVQVKRISWCSGAAQGYIEQAISWEADVYISGEVSEQTSHIACEAGIHYLAAGHHATETWGVKALALHLKTELGLDCQYIDVPNPV